MGRKQNLTKAKPKLRVPKASSSSSSAAASEQQQQHDQLDTDTDAVSSSSSWAKAEFRGAGGIGTGSATSTSTAAGRPSFGFGGALSAGTANTCRPAAGPAAAMAAMRQPSIRSAQYMEDASFEIVPQPRVARSSRQSADDVMGKTPDNVDSSGTPKSNRKTKDPASTATTAKSSSVRSDRLRDPKEVEDEKKERAKGACGTPTCMDNDGDDQEEEEGEGEELVACESGEMNKRSNPIGSADNALADGDNVDPGQKMAPNDDPPPPKVRHSSTLSQSSSYRFDDDPEPEERPPTPPKHETEAFESTIVNGRKMISVTDGNTSEVISRRNLSVRLPDVHGSGGGGGGGGGGDGGVGDDGNNMGHKSLASLDLDKAGVFANIDSVGDGADDGVPNSNLESPARTRSALLESLQNSQISIDFSLGQYSQHSVDTIADRDVDDGRGGDGVVLSPMDSKSRMKSVEEEEGIAQEDKDDSGAMPVEERWQMWKREAMQVSGEGVLPLAGESSRTIRPRGSFTSAGGGIDDDLSTQWPYSKRKEENRPVRRSSDSHVPRAKPALAEGDSADSITELLRHISSGGMKNADGGAGDDWRPPSGKSTFNDSWGSLTSIDESRQGTNKNFLGSGRKMSMPNLDLFTSLYRTGGSESTEAAAGTKRRRRTVEQILIDAKGILRPTDGTVEAETVSEQTVIEEDRHTAGGKREDTGESGGLSRLYPKTVPHGRRRSSVTFNEAAATPAYKQQAVHPDREVAALYELFQPLSRPPISVEAVANVIRDERSRWDANNSSTSWNSVSSFGDVPMPRTPVIGTLQVGQFSDGKVAYGPSAVLSASPPSDNFLSLPLYIQSALLRILLRLLTSEEDSEYNEACLFPYLEGDGESQNDNDCDPGTAACEMQGARLDSQDGGPTNRTGSDHQTTSGEDAWEGSGSLMWKDTATSIGQGSEEFPTADGGIDRRRAFREMMKKNRIDGNAASEENLLKSFTSIRRGLGQEVDELSIVDRLHRVVAFCSFGHWGSKDKYACVSALLRLYEEAARFDPTKESLDDETDSIEKDREILYERRVVGPLARLLGLFSAAIVAPRQLKKMLDLIGGTTDSMKSAQNSVDRPLSLPSRLVLLRALKDSADGGLTSHLSSNPLGDKSSGPTNFFVFSRGTGISRAVQPTLEDVTMVPPSGGPAWPFKSDGWATSIWFRAESFLGPSSATSSEPASSGRPRLRRGGPSATEEDQKDTATLLDMRSADGAGISIRLVPFATGAATLTVTSYDSAPTPASLSYLSTRTLTAALHSSQPQSVRLKGCVLLPRVWYHVSIRHTKPKFRGLSLSNVRDEVTIMLDGKRMLTEQLRFPRVTNDACPYTVTMGSNFDGQIGSLHIFKDFVSQATLKALFEETAGKTQDTIVLQASNAPSTTNQGRINSSSSARVGMSNPSISARRPSLHSVGGAIHQADIDDMVVSGSVRNLHDKDDTTISTQFMARHVSVPKPATATVLDLGEDEGKGRAELRDASFKCHLFLVWDPARTIERAGKKVLLEAHSALHASVGGSVATWTVAGVKDSIGSCGGLQSLLPVFDELLRGDGCSDSNGQSLRGGEATNAALVPMLLAVLSAFVRGHAENAREMIRCGGIDVIELLLRQNKQHGRSAMRVLRFSKASAMFLVDVLKDLRAASAHSPDLYHLVFERILFNLHLWFGDVVRLPGVVLYTTLLPELSSIAREEPARVFRCLSMTSIVEFIKEHIYLGADNTEIDRLAVDNHDSLFVRNGACGLSDLIPLTIVERRHAMDVMIGIVIAMLSSELSKDQIGPLLHFVSYSLDSEWDQVTAQGGEQGQQNLSASNASNRNERNLATTKICVALLYLLQKEASLSESLTSYFTSKDAVGSWMLCCLVNTFDDLTRSIGIRMLVEFLSTVSPSFATPSTQQHHVSANVTVENKSGENGGDVTLQAKETASISQTRGTIEKMKAMSSGFISTASQIQTSQAHTSIQLKLLWHLLKCHRERLGEASHAAMVHMLVDSPMASGLTQDDAVIPDTVHAGFAAYRFHMGWLTHNQPLTPHLGSDALIRSDYAVSTFFRLLRFLPTDMRAKWIFDIICLVRVAPSTMSALLGNNDWQPQMFHLLSESIEEISSYTSRIKSPACVFGVDITDDVDEPAEGTSTSQVEGKRNLLGFSLPKEKPLPQDMVRRFDLIVKLYSLLLGYSIRRGGDEAFNAMETAASLQRTCVNGHETFSCLLSHVLAELIEQGTVADIDTSGDMQESNRALKNSAKLVVKSILSNGSAGLDIASAVKIWRCLRHLSAIVVGVVTSSGFGVADLFDYRNQHASAFDELSGGLHGIRLQSGLLPGMTAEQAAVETTPFNVQSKTSISRSYRRNCVNLSSSLLCLLDAFIFPPEALDSEDQESQLFGLTLVRSTEPRLGQAQGPLLASLIRLSLVLLSHLEPSSVLFLQCCSRLKCLFSWTIELIRESVASVGGYSSAFSDKSGKLDRLVLAVVLQSHRALSRCSAVLVEIESTSYRKYFASEDSKSRNLKRLLRSTQELRETVHLAFSQRNDVCRSGLSLEAYESLQTSLEEPPAKTRRGRKGTTGSSRSKSRRESASSEDMVRAFLSSPWITGFMDVDSYERSNGGGKGTFSVPEMASNGQKWRNRTASTTGFDAVEALAKEKDEIISEMNRCFDKPFERYLDEQRAWAETDAVRDLEYEGDVVVKTLAGRHGNDLDFSEHQRTVRDESTQSRIVAIEKKIVEPWKPLQYWKLPTATDPLHRRVVLVYNRHFRDHKDASYELMLIRDREKAQREREERLRKKAEKEEEAASRRASAGSLSQTNASMFDDDSEMIENYNPESSASDMAAAMRAAREGIVPIAQAEANLKAEEEDEDDYIDQEEEEEEEGYGKGDELEYSADGVGEDDVQGHGKADAKERRIEDARREWANADYVGDDSANKESDFKDLQEDEWAREFIWSKDERVVSRFEAVSVVTLRTITDGDILLTSHGIYFRPSGQELDVMTKESVGKGSAHDDQEDEDKGGTLGSNKRWRLSRLRDVHGRRYMLRPSAIELFFVDMSNSLFINFQPHVRDAFYSKIRSRCLVPLLRSPKTLAPRTVFHRSNLTELWRQRRISNFDYIMQLNIMAGRSFNDIGQYPVFPWVLADYESPSLDLNDSRTFRDLTKPVGALNPDRLAQLIERYNSLDGFPEEQKFLYGSHYSSPGFVLYYLIRVEPFTSMHITLQSGRFDVADRLFYSIAETWKSCLTSTSDVKELIPEFYTCPEIFLNTNDFDLGTTQSKIKVHDVQLPPWAKGSAHEFVRLHRLALESEYVSNNLHHWVDLIFGYQQRGEEAAKAHNIFHYLSYEGAVDIEKISDDIDRQAIESHVSNFGQCPSQILTKQPHPPRHPRPSWRPICQELSKLKDLRVFTPRKQFGGYQGSEANGAVLSIHPMSSCCVVIYGDLSIGTYRWAATSASSGNRSASSFSFKMQSLRNLGTRNMTLNGEVFNSMFPLSASLAARKDEFADRNGRLSIGNWSFAVLLGGAAKDAHRRRQASSRTKVGEVPLSTLEASSYLISSGYVDNSIKCHTLDTLRQKDSSDGGHRGGGINCISADDEELICTGGVDGTVRIFVVDHDAMSQALADGYVKTSSSPSSSSTATSKILQLVHVCFGHQAPITCVSLSSDLDIVVSGSQDGTICVHSPRRGRYLRKIHASHFYLQKKYYDAARAQKSVGVRKIALDRHGTIIVHLNDGMLHSYSVNGTVLCGADAGEKLNCMRLCADGEVLITGGESSHVVIRQTSDLSVRCVLDLTSHGPITDIALTPSSSDSAHQYILIGTSDGRVTIIGENNTEEEDDDRGESGLAYLDAN